MSGMRSALVGVLPSEPPGLKQTETREAVVSRLPEGLFPGGAKAGWWAKTVQLDLEAKVWSSGSSPSRFAGTRPERTTGQPDRTDARSKGTLLPWIRSSARSRQNGSGRKGGGEWHIRWMPRTSVSTIFEGESMRPTSCPAERHCWAGSRRSWGRLNGREGHLARRSAVRTQKPQAPGIAIERDRSGQAVHSLAQAGDRRLLPKAVRIESVRLAARRGDREARSGGDARYRGAARSSMRPT